MTLHCSILKIKYLRILIFADSLIAISEQPLLLFYKISIKEPWPYQKEVFNNNIHFYCTSNLEFNMFHTSCLEFCFGMYSPLF